MDMFFGVSSSRKLRSKKIRKKKQKKNAAEIWMGYCPNCIVKKKKIVLQPCNCIARERAGKIVLQEKGVVGLGLYYNRKKLYCSLGV